MKINFLPVLQMALVEACTGSTTIKNPGGGCDKMLGPSKGLFAGPTDLVIPSGTTDIVTYMKQQIHAAAGSRVYPLFNYQRPIFGMNVTPATDVSETSDYTGEIIFIRPGTENREYLTTKGGLCFAEALLSFRNSGLGFMDIDGAGLYVLAKQSDGSYRFLNTLNMSSGITAATGNTVFKNRFTLSYDPEQYITATVFDDGLGLLQLRALEDVVLSEGDQTQTTTNIFVKIATECGGKDVIALVGAALEDESNFIVKDDTGTPVAISAAAIIGGEIRLTGTFVSADTYTVELAATPTLYTNNVFYYEGTNAVEITIP